MTEPALLVVGERTNKRDVSRIDSAPVPSNPMEMLALAAHRGVDMEQLRMFMDLNDRHEKAVAKKAYMEALAAFKKNPPKVIKDLTNTQYKSKYASLGNLVNTVNQALGEHGLNARWSLAQEGNVIKVACILSHTLGHSESVDLQSVPDSSGSKNPLQQIKSTITYLEGATFQAITGIVASNEGDDDGNGSGGKPPQKATMPEGFENWSLDMEALADEGTTRLQDAWKKAPDAFRRYVVAAEGTWWAQMKSKAAKVQP